MRQAGELEHAAVAQLRTALEAEISEIYELLT